MMAATRSNVWIALCVSAALHVLLLLIPPGERPIPTGHRFHLSPVPSAAWIELLRASRPELTVDGMERLPGPAFVLPRLPLADVPFDDDLPEPAAPELTKTDSLWLAARTEKGLWLPPEDVPIDLNQLALEMEARKDREVERLDEYARYFAGDADTTDQASQSHGRARQVVMRAIESMGGWDALAALTELHAGVWMASTTHVFRGSETRVPLYYYPVARWHFSTEDGFSRESAPVELSLDPNHPNEPYQLYNPKELSAYRILFTNLWQHGPELPNDGTRKRFEGHVTRWHFLERFLGHAVVLSYIGPVYHGHRHTEVEAILVNDHKYGQYFEAYFSRETGLLVAVTEGFTQFEKEWYWRKYRRHLREWTTEFADYRSVKGVLLPHFIRRRQGSASVSIHLQTAPDAESLSSSPPVHQASSDHRRRRDQPW